MPVVRFGLRIFVFLRRLAYISSAMFDILQYVRVRVTRPSGEFLSFKF